MQFFAPLFTLATLAIFTSAQSTTLNTAPTTTYALSPQQSCLTTCKPGDVNCAAACIGSAHPNSVQVSQTNECAARCIQGDGSAAMTDVYSKCISACIASYYPTTQTVAAAVGSVSSMATSKVSGTGSAAGSASGTGAASKTGITVSGSSTATGTAAAATASKASGDRITPFVGSFGAIVMAVLTL